MPKKDDEGQCLRSPQASKGMPSSGPMCGKN